MMRYMLLGLMLVVFPALAQEWKVDQGRSQVRFVITQMNVPVEGGFGRFTMKARFDPAKPENAPLLRVELDVASIDTGSAEGDDEARRPLWFDAARHPKATFLCTSVKKQKDGRYLASGDLTLKGRSRPITVPFSLAPQPNGAWLAEGRVPVSRADFGIGGGEWNDVVADRAEVRFRIWLMP